MKYFCTISFLLNCCFIISCVERGPKGPSSTKTIQPEQQALSLSKWTPIRSYTLGPELVKIDNNIRELINEKEHASKDLKELIDKGLSSPDTLTFEEKIALKDTRLWIGEYGIEKARKERIDIPIFTQLINDRPWFKGKIDGNSFLVGYTQQEIDGILYYETPEFRKYYMDVLGDEKILENPLIGSLKEQAREIKASSRAIPHINFASKDEITIIKTLLERYPGIIVGETYHHERSPKQFLIDNMAALSNAGVSTIFMEHLFYESQQITLDYYLKSDSSNLPMDLDLYLKRTDAGHSGFGFITPITPGFKDLVISAKQKGIRIVAIDTEIAAKTGLDGMGGANKSRLVAMNRQAAAIIAREMKGNKGKYLIFCGAAHAIRTEGVDGLSQLLGIPSIFVLNAKNKKNKILTNVNPATYFKKNIYEGIVSAVMRR